MKNRLIITNEEKNRILSIHKIAINESNMSKFLKKSLVIKEQDLDNAPSEKTPPPLKNKEKIEKVKQKGQEIIDKFKKVKDEVIDDPNEDGSELSRWWDKIKGDPENDGTMLNRKKTPGQTKIENAWQSVRLYAIQNNLKSHTETTGTHEEAKTYYDIKGTKFYEDGYKMGTDKKLVPYFEDDDALTIVYPEKKPETKIETNPVTTPTPTKVEPETFNPGDN
jgi:hypothetical protein